MNKSTVRPNANIYKDSSSGKLVSVVVPIYKVEKYLSRCVDSILKQDHTNLQIILVDDGSPDKCPDICDAYAKRDSRITVIHKVNGGLSDARNSGIEVAKGEYIAFIDSDDYIDERFISYLYGLAQKYNADVSVCGYTEVSDGSSKAHVRSNTKSETLLSSIDAMRKLFIGHEYGYVTAWNKLYKTNLFIDNNIRYPVGKIFEDAFTTYKLFYYANNVACSDKALYFYLRRPDSITGTVDDSHWRLKMEYLREMDLFMRDHDIPLAKELKANYLIVSLHYLGLMTLPGRYNKTKWSELRANVIHGMPGCYLNGRLPISKKVAATLVLLGWEPYKFISGLLPS